jgi:hypothetical protein
MLKRQAATQEVGTRVRLPAAVEEPFDVYRNGVQQAEGEDFVREGRVLEFRKPLLNEGRLGLWRWLAGAFGIGTYRENDVVDVRYERDGKPMVAHDLPTHEPSRIARTRTRGDHA